MSSTLTTVLGIPIITGNMIVNKTGIDNALERIDKAVLPVSHADRDVHWEGWKANTVYANNDVIRLDDMPSWGYLECIIAGTSAVNMPARPYAPQDVIDDGTVRWIVRQIGGKVNHKDLNGRNLPEQHIIDSITGLKGALDEKASLTQLEDRAKAVKVDAETYTKQKIADLIDGAPEALDTLKELADALKNDENALSSITLNLAGKVDKTAGKELSANDYDNFAKAKVDFITVTKAVNLDAVHTHSNKALLDTYTQTDANLADAVTRKHSHSNKSVLDYITSSDDKILYSGKQLAAKKDAIKYAIVL